MLPLSNKLIDDYERILAEKKLCEKNIFVFDKTIIGTKGLLFNVVSEVRDSGGRTGNAFKICERALGSDIPFSTLDGNRPFRVFIINETTCRDWMISEDPIVPTAEKGLRETPHRLFLSSATGYITIDLFDRIMDAFISWWTQGHPGVDCLLICDNLAIHKNKAIVAKAEHRGVHLLTIMPGSSHWFQVHDQEPFAELKKSLIIIFYDVFADPDPDHGATLDLRLGEFYKA